MLPDDLRRLPVFKAVEFLFLVILPAGAALAMSVGLAVHLTHRISQRLRDRDARRGSRMA